ncbi:alpha/beta fold hydrolase [Amycolatopsis sp. RM579]|uniref:Alpha/beta fold hydrolase n=1 Tax=Amycolatopsis pithecellobii TaxID=664692 RepID=A0A6N7Z340_9PSEU|nr:alpha/beta fold hydrolase [Amycolatopsis pithecellobii]
MPLDYRAQAPESRNIKIEVSRIPAAKPERRKGVLMLNGGGPGASLDVPTMFGGLLSRQIRDSYDLVAFDPRGIGHSTPIDCGRQADEMIRDEQLEVLSFPTADGSIDANVAYSHRMADQCAALSGDLLPHLTTANIARDMDRIRATLGERTVSYYGISWGTYLGSIYRALFPQNVDRMVIDSSVDPNERGYEDFRLFSGAMEDRWPDLARFGVAQKDVVHLGDTEADVRRNYLAMTAELDRTPVTLPGTKARIDGNFIRLFTWQLSYNDHNLTATAGAPVSQLASLWRAGSNLAAHKATDEDRNYLTTVANDFINAGVLPGLPPDNLLSTGWAISCADKAWPRDVRTYAHNTAADRARFPLMAGAPANVAPCSFWSTQPRDAEPKVQSVGTRNVLILQNRRDPSTPLRAAQGMKKAMGSDAVLVEVDAGGHGVLVHPQPNSCAISAMNKYFMTGELPAGDLTCS